MFFRNKLQQSSCQCPAFLPLAPGLWNLLVFMILTVQKRWEKNKDERTCFLYLQKLERKRYSMGNSLHLSGDAPRASSPALWAKGRGSERPLSAEPLALSRIEHLLYPEYHLRWFFKWALPIWICVRWCGTINLCEALIRISISTVPALAG